MAGVGFNVTSGEVALVAATAKTVLQIKAATNQRALIKSIRIFGKSAAGGTDPVIKVRMTRSTANFGTLTAVTPQKNDTTDDETLQTTAGKDATVEPTTPTDSQILWELQPQAGVIEFLPPGGEIKVPGGTAVNFEFTTPSGTPTVAITVGGEE